MQRWKVFKQIILLLFEIILKDFSIFILCWFHVNFLDLGYQFAIVFRPETYIIKISIINKKDLTN